MMLIDIFAKNNNKNMKKINDISIGWKNGVFPLNRKKKTTK